MKLFELQKKILPPEEKIFYSLFEESSEVCLQTSKLFLEIINDNVNEERLVVAKSYKHKSNDISKQILNTLNQTFITPFDREDIQLLATLLNKITKRIVKASFNLRTYRINEYNETMKKQAETLVRAVEEVNFVVSQLKVKDNANIIFESNHKSKEIETHGDEILHTLMDDLFSGNYEALTVIKLRDVYKDIENAMDTCFSVSDEIVNIVIKNT